MDRKEYKRLKKMSFKFPINLRKKKKSLNKKSKKITLQCV